MSPVQRFCPVCDRLFLDSEAVLVCQECSVMHHPACWIRNDGCATSAEHTQSPLPRAYGLVAPAHGPGDPAGETRTAARSAHPGPPADRLSRQRSGSGSPAIIGEAPPVPSEGGPDPRPAPAPRLASPPPEPPGTTIRHGRYVPPGDDLGPVRSGMPKIYGRPTWLRFWFVPVAAAIAIGAAIITVWVIGVLAGDDDTAAGDDDFVATATSAPPTATAATAAATGTPEPAETPGTPAPSATATFVPTTGKFLIGETLVVTGAGDCLNVRVGPARSNDAIVCLDDGAQVTVTEGPTESDTFTWWKVNTPLGEGWAVEDFLQRAE